MDSQGPALGFGTHICLTLFHLQEQFWGRYHQHTYGADPGPNSHAAAGGTRADTSVSLSQISPIVAQGVVHVLYTEAKRISNGGDVFCGQLFANNGSEILRSEDESLCLSDPTLQQMEWLVDGVEDNGIFVPPPKTDASNSQEVLTIALVSTTSGLTLIMCCVCGISCALMKYVSWSTDRQHRKEQAAAKMRQDSWSAAHTSLLRTLCHDLKGVQP